MTTPADLAAMVAELRALEQKGTPGPWFNTDDTVATKEGERSSYPPKPECICHGNDGEYIENPKAWEDAALIAAMRNALPALLACAEQNGTLWVRYSHALNDLEGQTELAGIAAERASKAEEDRDEMRDARDHNARAIETLTAGMIALCERGEALRAALVAAAHALKRVHPYTEGDFGDANHFWETIGSAIAAAEKALAETAGDRDWRKLQCPECDSWLENSITADGTANCANCKHRWEPTAWEAGR